MQRRLQVGDLRVDGGALRLRLPSMRVASSPDSCSICARRLLRGFGGLPKLQELELEIVGATLLRRDGETLGVIRLLRRCELGIDGIALRARFLGARARPGHGRIELVELALARDARRAARCRARRTSRLAR